MPEVFFYHLERASMESVLPELLEKSLQRGWRAEVRCRTAEQLAAIDALLWTYKDDSFLPHGTDAAERQPIFLTDGTTAPHAAQVLFLLGAELDDPIALRGLERCVAIIDGADEASIRAARTLWKTVKSEGFETTYWKQSTETGRFERED